jgi:hypothetical protein
MVVVSVVFFVFFHVRMCMSLVCFDKPMLAAPMNRGKCASCTCRVALGRRVVECPEQSALHVVGDVAQVYEA